MRSFKGSWSLLRVLQGFLSVPFKAPFEGALRAPLTVPLRIPFKRWFSKSACNGALQELYRVPLRGAGGFYSSLKRHHRFLQ